MQTFLSVKKVRHSHSNHSGAHVKLGQACSRVRKDRESGFHDCGVLRASLFKFRGGRTNPFQLLYRTCEARASTFQCQDRSSKQFSTLWRFYEARESLFNCQERSRKLFSSLWSC